MLLPVVVVGAALAALAPAQRTLEDLELPKAEAWMAACTDAFGFHHAPGREDVAWFVAVQREDHDADKSGHFLVAWSDRGGGEVKRCDLGDNLGKEDWFVGPVWTRGADRLAVAIVCGEDHRRTTKVVVVDTRTATARTWLEDVYPASLSWTADGSLLAVGSAGLVRVMKGPGDEAFRREIPTESTWGSAAAITADGEQLLAMGSRGVYLLARKGEPERLGDVPREATIFEAPQWSADGTKAVAAAGGGVVFVDLAKKTVRSVGEKELGGRAVAVVWVPETEHVLAAVETVRDGPAVEVLLGAGHARQRYSVVPTWIAGDSGRVLPAARLRSATPDPSRARWFQRPRLSEALSRWGG